MHQQIIWWKSIYFLPYLSLFDTIYAAREYTLSFISWLFQMMRLHGYVPNAKNQFDFVLLCSYNVDKYPDFRSICHENVISWELMCVCVCVCGCRFCKWILFMKHLLKCVNQLHFAQSELTWIVPIYSAKID